MDVLIRQAKASDFARLQELYSLLLVTDDPTVAVEQAECRFGDILCSADQTIYMAEAGGEVVGTYALIFIPGLTHGARDSAVVEDVVVAPGKRRLGIGKGMMRDAMMRCSQRGCYKLVLSSHLQRHEAHDFYEGLGFSKHGFSFLIPAPDIMPRSIAG